MSEENVQENLNDVENLEKTTSGHNYSLKNENDAYGTYRCKTFNKKF